ncbi:hypothetical protein DL98DRAFT_591007 [Cadophora sp. DSE1049]|nr:hypothetical protein DL98DRAFT_591007 [Cadophora sp. DSE1049]
MSSSPSSSSSANPERDQATHAALCSSTAATEERLGSDETVDQIMISNLEALSVSQLPKSTILESTQPSGNPEHGAKKELTLEEYKAHVRLEDYSGRVYNDLKNTAESLKLAVPGDCTVWAEAIGHDKCPDDDNPPKGPLWVSFKAAADVLKKEHGLSVAASWRAVQHYADRNEALHSKAGFLKTARAWAELVSQIELDLDQLKSFLPLDLQKFENDHRQIMQYYKARVAEQEMKGKDKAVKEEMKDNSNAIMMDEAENMFDHQPSSQDTLNEYLEKLQVLSSDLLSLDTEECFKALGECCEILQKKKLQLSNEKSRAEKMARREQKKKSRESGS